MALAGRTYLILGFANKHSCAHWIGEALSSQRAHVIHSLSSERHVNKLKAATAHWETAPSVVYYDALQAGASDRLTEQVASCADAVHGIVHAIAHAPAGALSRPASECSAADFHSTMQVSAWSLLDVARAMLPLLDAAAAAGATDRSITTLSFAGSTRVAPGYGVMGIAKAALEASVRELAAELGSCGIRVNAVSPGPINTLAARGIPGFQTMKAQMRERQLLPACELDAQHVGRTVAWLASPAAAGITGTVLPVDAGVHARL